MLAKLFDVVDKDARVVGDRLRTVMPSIMRRRNGLIRFVIARLALVADRSDFVLAADNAKHLADEVCPAAALLSRMGLIPC